MRDECDSLIFQHIDKCCGKRVRITECRIEKYLGEKEERKTADRVYARLTSVHQLYFFLFIISMCQLGTLLANVLD